MEILPAIDLRGGKCVRLTQGRFDEETVFGDDPVAVAEHFEGDGARWLHVVDLDGAREGTSAHLETLRSLADAVGMKIEFGGGIRSEKTAEAALQAGAERVIVGTRAVREPEWFRDLAGTFPGHVALGLDAKDGRLAVEGWQEASQRTAADLVRELEGVKIAAIVYTDIARDGMMTGPNVDTTAVLTEASPWPVVASGGVTTVDDIRRLVCTGCWGAIVGRSLYEGPMTVADALAAAGEGTTEKS